MIVSPARVRLTTGGTRPASAQARLPAIDSAVGERESNRSGNVGEDPPDPYERVILIPVSASAASYTWPQSLGLHPVASTTPVPVQQHTMLSVDFLPETFRSRDYSPQIPRFLSPEAAPEDVNNKLSTLEKEMMDRFHDLDVLKKEVQHLQGSAKGKSHQTSESSSPEEAKTTASAPVLLKRGRSASHSRPGSEEESEDSSKAELSRLRKDRRVMADLLKQSQRDLTKRDLVIGQLQRANTKLQQDLERLLESLTSDSPMDKSQNQFHSQTSEPCSDQETFKETAQQLELEASRQEPKATQADILVVQSSEMLPDYKSCLRDIVDTVAESSLASRCELEGGLEMMKYKTCLAENGQCFDAYWFQSTFRFFWKNVTDKVDALERRAASLESANNDKEDVFSTLLSAKERHLTELMSEMRKVSVQLERQMETVMELHDESASLRRENEHLVHQLEDTHIRKGLVQAKYRELQAKYNELQKEQTLASELLASQFRTQWREQLDKVLDFLSHAEGKLSSKGRTANSIEEILRMRPTLTNKDVEKLEGAVFKVYQNELQWIRTSLMDRENNNNERYRNAITSPFKLEKTFDVPDQSGHHNYEQILLENMEPKREWKRLGASHKMTEASPPSSSKKEDVAKMEPVDQVEPPIVKDSIFSDDVDWDDLFGKFYFNEDLPESDSENVSSEDAGNLEDDDNPCSTFTINEDREVLETIPEGEENSVSEASAGQPVQSEPEPAPTTSAVTSTTVTHNPVFQDLSSVHASNPCSSYNIDPEDGSELTCPESWDMTDRLPIDVLKSSYEKAKRDVNYSPSRNPMILYPMIEEEEEEAAVRTDQGQGTSYAKDREAEVCEYYANQCALEEEDALSVILETDSEEDESELKLVVSAADVLSGDSGEGDAVQVQRPPSGGDEDIGETLDAYGEEEGGEAMADELSQSSCVLVEVRSAPVLMNVCSSEPAPEKEESSPENGERLTVVCRNCNGKYPQATNPSGQNKEEAQEENRTEDDISTTFEDIIEEILNESDVRSKTTDTKDASKVQEDKVEVQETVEEFLQAAEAELAACPVAKKTHEDNTTQTIEGLETEVLRSDRVREEASQVEEEGLADVSHLEQRETWSQTESAVESVLKDPMQSETSETQTDIVGNHLDDRLVELETAITEMKEVKEQHMKVACGVAEQLEELRSQESQWASKELHYQDEVRAWKDNVQLQNELLQQLREDLEATQEKLRLAESDSQQLKALVAELESLVVRPDKLQNKESQTDQDYNRELLLYIEKLRAEADEYREEMRKQEEVIQEVKRETEKTMRHLQTLKAEAADKIQRETSEWQRLVKDKDSEINLLRGELLQLSDLVEKKGVIISQQIQNIKDLLSELNRCETELHAKCKLVQELQQQREEGSSSQGAGQTEEEKLLSIGERCMREQHHQTLAQQGLLLDRLHRRLRTLEEQLDLYTAGGQNLSASVSSLPPEGGVRRKTSSRGTGREGARQPQRTEGRQGGEEEEEQEEDEVWSLAGRETASSEDTENVQFMHDDYFASVLEKAHRMTDQDVIAPPVKKTLTIRTVRDRPVPLPFKTGKILFLQQDLENRRKEILKTEMKLRRIQAKMAEEVKKGRQPLKAT